MAEEMSVASVIEESIPKSALNAETILKLRNAVRNGLAKRKELQSRLNTLENEDLTREEKAVWQAACLWILGQFDQAEVAAKKLPSAMSNVIRGGLALECGRHEVAVELLQKASNALPRAPKVTAEYAAALRVIGKVDKALEIIEKNETDDSDLWLQKGWCCETLGQQENACNAYEKALALEPRNAEAAFRLAYYLDLRGEDAKAIELYKKVVGEGATFINAMVNLALLYEDQNDVDNAIVYLKNALKADPTNRRVALYLRDAIESLDMYYDERQRKESDRLDVILRLAVNDFEFSVRSRNCLAKMNVKTLGDIIKKTEIELLAYKNFGETSLREIKQLLESKGLWLGMYKDDEQKRARAQRLNLEPDNVVLSKLIADLDLSVRSQKCMQRLNIETIGDLVDKTEADLLATKNFGQTSMTEIKLKLAELSLSLKTVD
ncbi:MAG: tetratricopeptide repeat protein [Planctomycetota bacterium]